MILWAFVAVDRGSVVGGLSKAAQAKLAEAVRELSMVADNEAEEPGR